MKEHNANTLENISLKILDSIHVYFSDHEGVQQEEDKMMKFQYAQPKFFDMCHLETKSNNYLTLYNFWTYRENKTTNIWSIPRMHLTFFCAHALFLVSNHPFAKFSLVLILKIFSFFGVFSVIPYGMTLNFNMERDIKARIW